jgi:hypothetical protein
MSAQACAGCGSTSCGPELWAQQRKCCPDCTHKPNARVIYQASASCHYYTPAVVRAWVWDFLQSMPGLDPATAEHNPMRALKYFTESHDGLAQDWEATLATLINRTLWLNPPYGAELKLWLPRWVAAAKASGQHALLLVPHRAETRWYQDAVRPHLNGELQWRGRLTFEDIHGEPIRSATTGRTEPARWASLIGYIGPDRQRFKRCGERVGAVNLLQRSERSAARIERAHIQGCQCGRCRQQKLFDA